MDVETKTILERLDLKRVKLISLNEFENSDLIAAKRGRTLVEYYWTCTPFLPLYILKRYKHEMITYIDADLMFFSSPEPIFNEFGKNSILVIEHRFKENSEEKEKDNGKYNVQFLTFRNDENGIACLKWWGKKCLEWCYNRHENGLIGDQAYLNSWESLFKGVYSMKNLGGGLAPWNINNYELTPKDDDLFVENDKLIFYHFHAFRIYLYNFFDLSFGYKFTEIQKKLIYEPYIKAIKNAILEVKKIDADFKSGYQKGFLRFYVAKLIKK